MSKTAEVLAERVRQDAKWGEQNHPDGTGSSVQIIDAMRAKARTDAAAKDGTVTWQLILTEEHAEALAESEWSLLRGELIQTAAVAVSWVEAGDRRLEAA